MNACATVLYEKMIALGLRFIGYAPTALQSQAEWFADADFSIVPANFCREINQFRFASGEIENWIELSAVGCILSETHHQVFREISSELVST